MNDRQRPRTGRPDSAEVSELRALGAAQPALADAAMMQIELIELTRRIQTRVATPGLRRSAEDVLKRLRGGQRLIGFEDVPFDWPDLRLAIRQTADILSRHGALESGDHLPIVSLAREGDALMTLVHAWYDESDLPPAARETSTLLAGYPPVLDDVLTVATRPFLVRAVEVTARDLPGHEWRQAWCLFCGGLPDLAIIQSDGDRHLICNRCLGRWQWDPNACPWCEAQGPSSIRTFASPDRRYRVYGCVKCRRYLKAYDSRGARRPVMPLVDAIVTLPLDAAAVQQGFE